MRTRSMRSFIGFSAVAVLLAAACSDAGRSVAPNARGASTKTNGLLGTILSTLVPPLQRTAPLASDVSWSFTAGPGGATSSNSAVGLTIAIPSGALGSTQTITVTALAGTPVAYKFEPHGLLFSKKAYLTQNLQGTNAGLSLLLSGAYFATDRLQLTPSGLAVVTELLSAVVNPFTQTVTFGIQHFSGYIVASGVSGGDSADDRW